MLDASTLWSSKLAAGIWVPMACGKHGSSVQFRQFPTSPSRAYSYPELGYDCAREQEGVLRALCIGVEEGRAQHLGHLINWKEGSEKVVSLHRFIGPLHLHQAALSCERSQKPRVEACLLLQHPAHLHATGLLRPKHRTC